MSTTLPDWARKLPNPTHAPDPDLIARILAPLSRLHPLLEEGRPYGTLALAPCVLPGIGAPQKVAFERRDVAPTSAHAQLANPWLRMDEHSPVHTLLGQATALLGILEEAFAGLLHRREKIESTGDGNGIHFVLRWPHRAFVIPPGPDSPLHVATLLAILQRIMATTPALSTPPARPKAAGHEARMGAMRTHITPLGMHINTFFPKPVW